MIPVFCLYFYWNHNLDCFVYYYDSINYICNQCVFVSIPVLYLNRSCSGLFSIQMFNMNLNKAPYDVWTLDYGRVRRNPRRFTGNRSTGSTCLEHVYSCAFASPSVCSSVRVCVAWARVGRMSRDGRATDGNIELARDAACRIARKTEWFRSTRVFAHGLYTFRHARPA